MQVLKKFCVTFFLSLLFFSGCNLVNPYPTDFVLVQHFNSNKTDFERLVKMFQEDSQLFRVSLDDGVWESFENKANLSDERLSEYESLLTKLNVEFIQRHKDQENIYLRVWGRSRIFIGGRSKYYVYSEKEIPNTVESLDEIYRSGRDANDLKRIKENWYLYLDVW